MQVMAVASAANTAVHAEEITKAAAFAQERAEREARLQRPLFVMPTKGVFTSGFGYRWGVLHGGIDIANSIGTPILAAADGVVIDAGPTAGYGAWVKLRHADGTVTLYGHVNSWTVNIGERVWAGDQIATHRQPRQLHRTAPALRGASERHRPRRPGRMAGQTGTQPRQLLSVSVSDADLPDPSDDDSSPPEDRHHPAGTLRAATRDRRVPHHPHRRPAGAADHLHPPGQAGSDRQGARPPSPKTAVATAVVTILSGWATAIIATDLITGWWASDRLFCVAVGFLTAVFAAATVGGLIALLLRRRLGRWLVVVGSVIGLMIFASLFVAGAKLEPVVYAIPVLPLLSIVLALLPATKRWAIRG